LAGAEATPAAWYGGEAAGGWLWARRVAGDVAAQPANSNDIRIGGVDLIACLLL